MFRNKRFNIPSPAEVLNTPSPRSTIQEPKLRPCYVQSRKALFHLWVHSARPVKPRGMEEDETAERYQLSATHGLVEFEDGTLARVWPQDIQFVDIRPEFEETAWPSLPFTFGEETENQEAGHGDN